MFDVRTYNLLIERNIITEEDNSLVFDDERYLHLDDSNYEIHE